MVTIDEAQDMLNDIAEALPPEFYVGLNGGILLLPDEKMSPYAKNDDLFILGEYVRSNIMATPLLGVMVLISFSDILFATDSVPAVISVSRDLFIVYTSNIFAVLGLRQLYFVIEHMQERFQYVRYGVAVILIFTGVKMLVGIVHAEIPTGISIIVIIAVLAASVIISVAVSKHMEKKKTEKTEE